MGEIPQPTLVERISAATYDPLLWVGERLGMGRRRAALVSQARGDVLEIGAGTGLNLKHYPAAGIDRLVLLEPMAGMAARLSARADRVRPGAEVSTASAEELPFEDSSFDTVVGTLVLCTVPDHEKALAEIGRVLRPGGVYLFVEHVRSEGRRLAHWQDRLRAPWAAMAEGCQCNRRTLESIRESLSLENVAEERWRGMPPLVKPLIVGRASA